MATSLINGFASSLPDNVGEVQEYQKILKLRDEIFAGTHPRLTVPAHAIRKVSPSSAASSASFPPSFSAPPQPAHLPSLSLNSGKETKPNTVPSVNENSVPVQKLSTISGIDPVLLLKSDELVKAETQLHRQRLEKSLRDHFEQKRLDARKRPAPGEAKPDFDITVVFAKAQEIAKPEGVSSPKEEASHSDSYDENSLYSSRAPDSTPEIGELEDSASSQNQNLSGGSFGADGPAEIQATAAHDVVAAAAAAVAAASSVAAAAGITTASAPRPYSPTTMARQASGVVDVNMTENGEEEEEGEYSPPEAVEQFNPPADMSLQSTVDPRTRPLRRYSEFDDDNNTKGTNSPNDKNMRTRGRANQRGRVGSPRQSPDASGQGHHPRKKRKLDKKTDKKKRNGGGSPDVKDEPVSPPPFHDVQPLGSSRLRPPTDNRPIIIDDDSAREVRYVPSQDPYLGSPAHSVSRPADPIVPLTEPRVIPRGAIRPLRAETDLRRVASMHNMRSEQPREYVDPAYDSPIRARAASFVRVNSPVRVESPRVVQDMSQPYEREPKQGARMVQSPAPVYREVYEDVEPGVRYVPEPMPPPPPPIERIVVDQWGRRFREIIQDRAPVVASRSYSTFPDRGQPAYYESYDRGRGQSVMVDAQQDPRIEQEMPPPQVVRHMVEPGMGYREVYEPLPPHRGGSVRPIEQSPRQSVLLDDRAEYRAPVRTGSVRPSTFRYEEMPLPPPTMGVRASSVRPGGREASIVVDNRSQLRREYLPVETPRYRVVEPETLYMDAQGREIAYVDGRADGSARYTQQY